MCYDIKANKKAQLARAKRKNDVAAIKEIEESILPLTDLPIYHASGFQHPKLLIYTDRSPDLPEVATWGLVPHWVKDRTQQQKFWNNTLNARGETIFEKPSFQDAARDQRCLIYINGFYEHHHQNGKTYPFYISSLNNEPLILAGLWNDWKDPETNISKNTFSIVTTEGNSLLEKIHNNPKLQGPRMPVILPAELADNWLFPVNDELDTKSLQELIKKYPEDELTAHPVKPLRGKNYLGNVEEASKIFSYPELKL
tara:strand:+ start:35775 stop:36539 length:765 start_codon:yes stop_codon:yes gene_type:complete